MHKKQIQRFFNKDTRGQGMVEFAIALPVVLLIVFGIIEVGFLLFSYSSVNSAAREAARYGIAIEDVGGAQRYYDCDGIVDAGLRIGRFAGMTASDIAIAYDHGPGTTNVADSCSELASNNPSQITFGDRIVVTVNHQYQPLISYMGLNIRPFTMQSTSSRTIFKNAEIIPGGGDTGGGGGGSANCYTLDFSVAGGTGSNEPTASPAEDCTNGDGLPGYSEGTDVTLTANPPINWHVNLWSGVDSTEADLLTAYLTMVADSVVQISYSPDSEVCYQLGEVTSTGTGSAPSQSASAYCASGYVEGEVVTFTANPAPGWGTLSWAGASKVDKTTATFVMPAVDGTDIIANYVECFSLNLYSESPGTWGGAPTVLTESDACSGETFREGEVLLLQAYPSPGYDVDAWNGANQLATNEDQASLTMPASVPSASVVYKAEPVLDAPTNLVVPNDFDAGDFKWNNGGGGSCTAIQFYFDNAMPPAGNWPKLPDYYNVYVKVDTAGGTVTSVYQVDSPTWSGASVGNGYNITFGAEAVFLSDPADVSKYAEVTYRCVFQDLIDPSVEK